MNEQQILFTAEVAHEVNRIYCAAIGDTSQPLWADAPEWQQNSAIDGVRFHLANPDAGPDLSHNNWMAQKLNDGWTFGPVKDPALKQHPCIVPYKDLPKEQQIKDYLFRGVVHLAMRHTEDEE